jgi:hypothetical protein
MANTKAMQKAQRELDESNRLREMDKQKKEKAEFNKAKNEMLAQL